MKTFAIIAAAGMALSAQPAAADTLSLVKVLTNPTPDAGDAFGRRVAVDDGVVVVGAPFDSPGVPTAGTAYLYDAATGTLLHTLGVPAPSVNDRFGNAVAIGGGRAIVGAYADDYDGFNGVGSAHIFDAVTGALTASLLNPNPSSNDRFGTRVSISDSFALVSSYKEDFGAVDAGAAYLFNAATGALVHSFFNPTPAVSDLFSADVAVSDGFSLIGAYYDDLTDVDGGAAYLFNNVSGALSQTFANPNSSAYDKFGSAVAINGSFALIGAAAEDAGGVNSGAAFLFDLYTGTLLHTFLNPTPGVSDYFGRSVSLNEDYALIGANGDDDLGLDAGAAYLFDLDTKALVQALHHPDPAADDEVGFSVGLDAGYAVVSALYDDVDGAGDAGSALLYAFDAGTTDVPAPPALLLLGTALLGGAALRHRRKA